MLQFTFLNFRAVGRSPRGPHSCAVGGPARGSSSTPPPRPCCRLCARVRVRAPSRHHAGSPPGGVGLRPPPAGPLPSCCRLRARPRPRAPSRHHGLPPASPAVAPGRPCGPRLRARPYFSYRSVKTWWRGLLLVLMCTQVGHPSGPGRSFISWSIGKSVMLCASCQSRRVAALL